MQFCTYEGNPEVGRREVAGIGNASTVSWRHSLLPLILMERGQPLQLPAT